MCYVFPQDILLYWRTQPPLDICSGYLCMPELKGQFPRVGVKVRVIWLLTQHENMLFDLLPWDSFIPLTISVVNWKRHVQRVLSYYRKMALQVFVYFWLKKEITCNISTMQAGVVLHGEEASLRSQIFKVAWEENYFSLFTSSVA